LQWAAFLSFCSGLFIDGIYLSLPFGLNAIAGMAVVYLIKIMCPILGTKERRGWLYCTASYVLIYYAVISCMLSPGHFPTLIFAAITSLIYNTLIWQIWRRM
jgi:hypothetical protein